MIIGIDLTWIIKSNDSGGAFHYATRLTKALVINTNEKIVVLVAPPLADLFDDLIANDNFCVITIESDKDFRRVISTQKIEVIHTPLQHFSYVTLSVPMINSLHDIQQYHFPEFFSKEDLEFREIYYKGSTNFSERVIVSYQHVKDDVVKYYGISPDKIDVCPVGIIETQFIGGCFSEVKAKYNLQDKYLFYSAGTWRHKNHIGLIKALKIIHEQYRLNIPLICTGYIYQDFFPQIEEVIIELKMQNMVRFLGYVPEADMLQLLTNATLVVIPTLYEAGSYPLLEAMAYGVPVICSDITSLPDSIGDRRFIFDPNNIDQMAKLIVDMLNNPDLIEENKSNSLEKMQTGKWASTVIAFVDSYGKAIESYPKNKCRVYIEKIINSYESEIIQLQQRLDLLVNEKASCDSRISEITNSLVWKTMAPFINIATKWKWFVRLIEFTKRK